MSNNNVVALIKQDTRKFILDLSDEKILFLLRDLIRDEFIKNFFSLSEIKIVYKYLPIDKLRTLTKMDKSDEDILKNVSDNIYKYDIDIRNIIKTLNPDEQKTFISNIPNNILREILLTSSDSQMDYLKSILIIKEDSQLEIFGHKSLSKESFSFIGVV